MKRKKLAIILSRFPYPIDKGDKLRAFHQIQYLANDHDIYLYTLTDSIPEKDSIKMMEAYCKEIHYFKMSFFHILIQSCLSVFKNIPVQVGYFYAPQIKSKIHKLLHLLQPDTIYCQLSRTALYAYELPFRKIIDFQDAFSMNYNRIQSQSSGLQKIFYKRESKLMQLFEKNMLDWFDEGTIISEYDRQHIAEGKNNLHVVGNGVDFSYFQPIHTEKKVDLLFLGNLSYLPNKNAVEFLINEMMPSLIVLNPNIQLHIVGASTPAEFSQYESKHVHFKGWVADVRKEYAEAILFVAPLFTGAGLQNKILEAMSMQIPCITTPIVNASLKAEENKHLYLASNAQEFIDKICYLLEHQDERNKLSTAAREFVETHYSWDQANKKLLVLI